MKYIKVNIQELLAALKPSEFRPFIKEAVLRKEYKKYMDHVFKNKDRIYIPFEIIDIEPPYSIKSFLDRKGYSIKNYKEGLAQNEKGRLIKIGKLLSQEKDLELIQEFNDSRSSTKQSLLIVISRHPYDIAGMTTGRHWEDTSCMEIGKMGKTYIYKDIENGTLVAYIIREKDKNIKHPISRILLKQFINTKNYSDKILYPERKMYGEQVKGFREALIEWLKTIQNMGSFVYKLTPSLYNDGTKYVGAIKKYSEDAEERLAYYEEHPEDLACKTDISLKVRLLYYEDHLNDSDAKDDDEIEIRLLYFKHNPNDSDIKTKLLITDTNLSTQQDTIKRLRKKYFENNPQDIDAKFDNDKEVKERYYARNPSDTDAKKESNTIRLIYYMANPNDSDAKKDKLESIKIMYYLNNTNDNDLLKEVVEFREKYYSLNYQTKKDKRAKLDPDIELKKQYFTNNPDDIDFKTNEAWQIRKMYYELNPDDSDAINDPSIFIKLKYAADHKEENPELLKNLQKKHLHKIRV